MSRMILIQAVLLLLFFDLLLGLKK